MKYTRIILTEKKKKKENPKNVLVVITENKEAWKS